MIFTKLFESSLFKNFLSLGVYQVGNLIIPLLIAPYVIRTIGIQNYGVVNVSLAIIIFFTVVVDYGFNLSATRDISISRGSVVKLGVIASRVIVSKIIILFFSIVFFGILIFSIPAFRVESTTHILSFLIVIGQALFPFWFFQGIEKMKYITVLLLGSRVFHLIMIFTFITKEQHYIYINFFSGISTTIAAIIAICIAYRRFDLKFKIPKLTEVLNELRNGFLLFVSNISNVSYSFLNIIILDFAISDKALVGSFSIAEKVISITKQILIVYSQVIYPHLCKLIGEGVDVVKTFFYKTYIPFLIMVILGSILIYSTSHMIIVFLSGNADHDAIDLLKTMSIVPVIITLNIPFYQTLLIYDLKKSYTTVLFLAALLNILLNLSLVYLFQATGTAYSIILTEAFISAALFGYVRRNRSIISNYKIYK